MSNPKTAITEIKKLMKQFGFLNEEPSLMSFKLQDNTILQAEKLEAGKSIVKINESFEQVALETGSYRLKENFEIEVTDGEIVTVKEIFLDATLEDGTKIKVEGDSLVEGAAVKVITEEAEIPTPDGVHTISDGTKVETKDGVIVKIEEVVEAEEEIEGDVNIEEDGELPEESMKQIYSLLKDMMEKVSEKMKNMEEKMNAMNNEFKAFKSEPAGKKISDGKTEFNKVSETSEDARIEAILKLRRK